MGKLIFLQNYFIYKERLWESRYALASHATDGTAVTVLDTLEKWNVNLYHNYRTLGPSYVGRDSIFGNLHVIGPHGESPFFRLYCTWESEDGIEERRPITHFCRTYADAAAVAQDLDPAISFPLEENIYKTLLKYRTSSSHG